MGIWLRGIDNHTARSVDIFYGYKGLAASSASPEEFDRTLPAHDVLTCDTVTGGKFDAFGISMEIGGRRYDFNIWDDNWRLHFQSHNHKRYQYLDILKNWGRYKIHIEESGLTIEDVSVDGWKLASSEVSKRYYPLFDRSTNPVPQENVRHPQRQSAVGPG